MSIHFRRGASAAALCVFSTSAAWADISAQDVWTDWRDYLASTGYQVSGSETMSGNTLTVTDITMSLPIPEEDSTLTIVIPSISLIENGDGTVNVDYPSPLPVRFDVTGGSEPASGEVVVTHSGSTMKISGDPQNMTYEHSSDNTTLTLGQVTAKGEPVPADTARVAISMDNTAGTTKTTLGDLRGFDQNFTVGQLAYDMAFKDPESADNGSFKGQLQGLTFSGTGSIPKDMDTTNMSAMLKAGFAVDGGFSYTGGNSALEGTGDGQSFAAQTSSQGGSFEFGMNASTLTYGVSGKATSISASGSDLPFPVELNLAETALRLVFPIAKSDDPQDFSFLLKLGDFTMSDMIWSIFDPAGNLPRDPATIGLDLAGKLKMLVDIMDPASAEAIANSPVPPGEIHAVTINSLLLQAVGAKLTGQGAFTFDNSDMQTIPGMPRPEGAIDLALNGANALIDNLIKMGIISDQEAMPARMMMGMFAVPGDGPDSLKSRIEINAQGHILANGQRIK